MTTIQHVARVFGWAFVVIAIWGAALTGTSMVADPEVAPRLWGLFPVNFLHNLVHLGFGLWGIWASRSDAGARVYTVAAGALYILLSVLGLFFEDGLGLVPLGGNDVWLHALLGIALLLTGTIVGGAGRPPKVEPSGTRTVHPPTTASSPEGTVTRIPVQPEEPEGQAKPVDPERAGSDGATDAAPPPEPPKNVVDAPPQQPERPPQTPEDEGPRSDSP